MRNTSARLAVAAVMLLSIFSVGYLRLSAPTSTAHAATFNANPPPFSRFKSPISPAALMGLTHRPGGSTIGSNTGGGDTGQVGPLQQIPVESNSLGQTPDQGAGPQGGIDAPPAGVIAFNNDPTSIEQNETSVTVRQTGPVGSIGANVDTVVGGVNDSRGFYYAPGIGCTPNAGKYCYPARNCVSLSGFSVSFDGGQHLAKSGCLPWVNDTFQPFGDPALDRNAAGGVYYASLGFDQNASTASRNGITIDAATSALFDPSNPCNNVSGSNGVDNTNPCWKGRIVYVGDQNPNPSTGACDMGYCTFADKEWIAVDRYSNSPYRGDVYVDWNSFTTAGPDSGTAHILFSRCHPDASNPTGFAYCTTPRVISQSGDIFTGGGGYITVTRDGTVLAAYSNYGTATGDYPVTSKMIVLAPGGATTEGYVPLANQTQFGTADSFPCLPNTYPATTRAGKSPCMPNTQPGALAGVTMRMPQFIKLDVDRSSAHRNMVYGTMEFCTVPQYVLIHNNIGELVYNGNCPKTDAMVFRTQLNFVNGPEGGQHFSNSPVTWQDVTRSAPGQQFFPSVSVDERSGDVLLTYNSTQDDQFQNMDSVYALIARAGAATFSGVPGTYQGRATQFPYQITKDPQGYFGQSSAVCPGFTASTGCPGYAPENGDYLQGLAYFGRLYTHFTGTYLQKGNNPSAAAGDYRVFSGGGFALPMNQDDNFLSRLLYGP